MPQLDIFIYPHLIIYSIILFLSLSFFLFNSILPKIFKILKFRSNLVKYLNIEENNLLTIKLEPKTYEKIINLRKEIEQRKTLINNINNVK